LAFAIYERFAVKIHVYHDAAPGLAQVPVLWLESYCGLSNGRSDDFCSIYYNLFIKYLYLDVNP